MVTSIMYRRIVGGIAVVVCVALPFVTSVIQRREYVGEFPKGGFNRDRAQYLTLEYEPKSRPTVVTTPTIDVGDAVRTPITLDELPAVDGLGRMDLTGTIVYGKKMQADVILTATILIPSDNGNAPQAIASATEMLTPHKHRSFQLKLPIPDRKGSFRLRIDILSPDLTPMQNVVAEGQVEIH